MKTLKDAPIKDKDVLLRVDFNVTVEGSRVTEDFRMRATIPTIQYLLNRGARRIILMSHFGRPKGERNPEHSLVYVARHLEDILGKSVKFFDDAIGEDLRQKIEKSEDKIILLENLRFYKGEEGNEDKFSRDVASLGDFFAQDAFGVCHREHASVVGVPKFLPSYAGLLVEKEVNALSLLLKNPERPFAALIGGAKISTKIKVIEKFLAIADNVALGGALANTALKARGMAVGKSLVEEGVEEDIKNIDFTSVKLHLPLDVKVAKDKDSIDGISTEGAGNVSVDQIILDIGPDTQKLFSNIIERSKTIVWNGPMGYIENEAFQEGTHSVAKDVAEASANAFTVVGGGDTYLILEELGIMDKVGFVSTGGGAMLDFLVKGTLPGLEVLG